MNSDLQQRLTELNLDILALEVELRLRMVRSLPVNREMSPSMARSQLWLLGQLPGILPDISAVLQDMQRFPTSSPVR